MRATILIATLPVFFVFPALADPAPTQAQIAGAIRVETWWSASTVLQPEVHLLLANDEDFSVPFLLEFEPRGDQGRIRCRGASPIADENPAAGWMTELAHRLRRHSLAALSPTQGVVPARGWTHRSYLVGFEPGLPPCTIPYRVRLRMDGEKESFIDGVIDVGPTGAPSGVSDTKGVEVKAMVEESRITREPTAILRFLAENTGSATASVGITDLRLNCASADPPKEESFFTALEGEGRGPMVISAGGRAVFVVGLNHPGKSAMLRSCSVTAEFSAFERDGRRVLLRRDFSLGPSGWYDTGAHGFRDADGSR